MPHQGKKTGKNRVGRRVFKAGIYMVAGLVVFTVLQVVLLKFVDPPFTASVAWQYATHRIRSKPYRPPAFYWTPLDSISPNLRKAVLAAEDQRFSDHHGFDFTEIRVAMQDIFENKRIRGASTISMQTARTVFLTPSRNIVRKLLEAYYTVLVELIWGKGRILEMYLNTVDWGTGIMGAEAAARKYFQTSAAALNRSQAARMAAILPNPHRFSPVQPSRYVTARSKKIQAGMRHMPLF